MKDSTAAVDIETAIVTPVVETLAADLLTPLAVKIGTTTSWDVHCPPVDESGPEQVTCVDGH